jgi:tetratricopeptide (TPR) repeat protein
MDKPVIFLPAARQIKLGLLIATLCVGVIACASSGQPTGEASSDERPTEARIHLATAERLIDIGEYQSALQEYLKAAEASDDPEVARMVTRLAGRLEAWPEAVLAATRWLEIDPEADAAYQVQVVALINQGRADEAADVLQIALDRLDAPDSSRWWRRAAMLVSAAQGSDTGQAVFERLESDHGDQAPVGELEHARSVLLWRQGEFERAYDLASAAAEESEAVDHLVWAAQLAVEREDLQQSLAYYRRARARDPDDVDLALSEAEVLRQLERDAEALTLLRELPAGSESLYTLGIYLVQLDRREEADAIWERLVDLPASARRDDHDFLAAQLGELVGREEAALAAYERVTDPARASEARLREAILLGRLDRVEEARERLAGLRESGDEGLTMQTWMVEAEILRTSGRPSEAVDLLAEPLANNPSSIDLLYARALNAAAAENVDLAEQDLRRIIQMDGDNAMALNALGYTLTDLTDRHQEAYRLIQRALEIDPDDPATLDSMGWVLYRLGRPADAVEYLRDALEGDRNGEIMAHLIEVLHALGREQEAGDLARQAREEFPDDPLVQATLDRLEGLP